MNKYICLCLLSMMTLPVFAQGVNAVHFTSNCGGVKSPLAGADLAPGLTLAQAKGAAQYNDIAKDKIRGFCEIKVTSVSSCTPFSFKSISTAENGNLDINLSDEGEGCHYAINDDDGVVTMTGVYLGIIDEVQSKNQEKASVIKGLNKYAQILQKSIRLFEAYNAGLPDKEPSKPQNAKEIAALKPLLQQIIDRGQISNEDFGKLGATLYAMAPLHGYNRVRTCADGSSSTKYSLIDDLLVSSSLSPANYDLAAKAEGACPLKLDTTGLSYESKGINSKAAGSSSKAVGQ